MIGHGRWATASYPIVYCLMSTIYCLLSDSYSCCRLFRGTCRHGDGRAAHVAGLPFVSISAAGRSQSALPIFRVPGSAGVRGAKGSAQMEPMAPPMMPHSGLPHVRTKPSLPPLDSAEPYSNSHQHVNT